MGLVVKWPKCLVVVGASCKVAKQNKIIEHRVLKVNINIITSSSSLKAAATVFDFTGTVLTWSV